MNQWFQKNIWWIAIVITLTIALFPQSFMLVGNLMVKYWSAYWLQGSLVSIFVLLIMILIRLGKKDKHAP